MLLLKRALDVIFAALLILLLGPVMLWIAARLWRAQGRPILYVAERMKTPDTAFGLLKFRTMTVAAANDAGVSGAHKASRITPMGERLRRRRLDEFPQLFNILKGDLSFVGPRPPLREYVEKFPELYECVLRSKPGVTGLASLKFHRHEERLLSRCRSAEETERVYCRLCIPKKAKLDLIYQYNYNLCFDFAIVYQTVINFFRQDRAR